MHPTLDIPRRPTNQRQYDWDSRVPSDYLDAGLSDLSSSVVELVQAWIAALTDNHDRPRPHGRNLLIMGPVGTGKTHAAFAVCHEMHFVGYPTWRGTVMPASFRWWLQEDLMCELRRDEIGVMQLVDLTSIVMLDDLGSGRETPWVLDQLYRLIDHCRRNERPMVVTTNLTLPELKNYLGEGGCSRLVKDSLVIEMRGDDRRGS